MIGPFSDDISLVDQPTPEGLTVPLDEKRLQGLEYPTDPKRRTEGERVVCHYGPSLSSDTLAHLPTCCCFLWPWNLGGGRLSFDRPSLSGIMVPNRITSCEHPNEQALYEVRNRPLNAVWLRIVRCQMFLPRHLN